MITSIAPIVAAHIVIMNKPKGKVMPDETKPVEIKPAAKPPETPAKPQVLDWDKAQLHLNAIEEYQMKFAGKPGFNPFIWLRDYHKPLANKLAEGDRSPELYVKIMGLKEIPPDGAALKISLTKPVVSQTTKTSVDKSAA